MIIRTLGSVQGKNLHPMSFSISPPSQLLSLSFSISSFPAASPLSQGAAEALPAPGAGLGQALPPHRKGSSSPLAQLHCSSSLPPQGFPGSFPLFPALPAAPLAHSKAFSTACLSHKSKPSLYLLRSDEGNQSLGSGKQNLGMTFSLSSVSFDGLKGCSGWRGNT